MRNKLTGRYERNYILYKIYFLGTMLIFAVGIAMIGTNQLANKLNQLLQVQDSQADTEVKWQDKVKLMVLDAGLDVSVADTIITRESNWNPTANHVNKNGTVDRGLWMINNIYHSEVSDNCAYEPICATREAIKIQKKEGWNGWYGYKNVK